VIRSDKVKSSLFGGVGFRNPTDPEYKGISTVNQGSTSGLYFDDASYFVTIRNIRDCQEDKGINNTEFDAFLTNMQNQVIDNVCREIIQAKGKMLYFENIYPYEKSFNETLEPSTKFIGFEIMPNMLNNQVGKIEWVELTFDSEVTFTLYLYNSNLKTAIKTQSVTTSANESKIVNLTDWFIDDDTTYKGGKFYLGYFESDLSGAKPIKRDFELANLAVSNAFYSIDPVRVDNSSTTLDDEKVDYVEDTYGLNLGMSIYRDYTQELINNKHLVFPAIQFGMAAKVLDLVRTSIRSNPTQRLTKEMIQDIEFELYGNASLGIEGINGKYAQRIETIKNALFFEPLLTVGTLR